MKRNSRKSDKENFYDNVKMTTMLVTPESERDNILKAFNNDPTAGHYGVDRTIARIANRFYCPKMRSDITNHVKKCTEC